MAITSGSGVYFDGATSARQDVAIELAPAMLLIRSQRGEVLAEWSYAEIEQIVAPEAVLRVAHRGSPTLARLEIRDPAFAAALDDIATTVDRTDTTQRRGRTKVAILVIAAVASFSFMALFALPAIATRLTPLVPEAVERKLAEAVEAQLRASFGSSVHGLPLDCGEIEVEKPGRAALQALIGRLTAAANLSMAVRAGVLRRNEINAIALPGGQIYLFAGLIAKAETPDELVGVIAHEIGHVARRDNVKAVLETAGLSFLFGILLGDFVGGGSIVVAARTVLQSSYSRETEAAADAYGVALMNKLGGDANALGRILSRVAGVHGTPPKILLDHPETSERVASIRSMAASASGQPLLGIAEWSALKRICVGQ